MTVEIYSTRQPVNIFGANFSPVKTPALANRSEYGFDPAIVIDLLEQDTRLKAAMRQQATGVVFEIGLYSYRHTGCWYARQPTLEAHLSGSAPDFVCEIAIQPVRMTVKTGSLRALPPCTPEYVAARYLACTFFAVNPDYRAWLISNELYRLPHTAGIAPSGVSTFKYAAKQMKWLHRYRAR